MSDTLVEEPQKEIKKLTVAEKKFNKQKSVVKSAIISATEQFVKKNGTLSDGKVLDAQQLRIANDMGSISSYITADGAKRFAKIFSEILGKDIVYPPPPPKTLHWVRFAAIKILSGGTNGHNYPVGTTAVVYADCLAYRTDGTKGNTLENDSNMYSPCTLEEINSISNETYASLIREFLVMA